uniref:MgtC/SapB/SrpB/YhiD N-terminal domain-containing protein n=1 Tax=Skeletonema marinoi TaxID=267567 RepID=A0A7S2LKU2_9STRA|mmetsp:Transcript_26292/g.44770  ORF Transcript_26292/g.44770 Transcript_26292/m.44770 type:complete len:163 (+) Transcript_26292:70-558(+)
MGGDDVVEEWVIAIRICGAAALAAIVGFEREASKKPACVKMHMLVAASAATFVGVALLNTQKWQLGDVNRVAAGVASGVGFLGAGTIAKKEMQVSGLITAAGIWLVAGIGFAVANGYWYIGVLATALAVVIQFGFFWFLSPTFWKDMVQKFPTTTTEDDKDD